MFRILTPSAVSGGSYGSVGQRLTLVRRNRGIGSRDRHLRPWGKRSDGKGTVSVVCHGIGPMEVHLSRPVKRICDGDPS